MKPATFAYHRPASVSEALDVLGAHGGEVKVLAGGQSLIPTLSLRLAHPAHLVDVNALSELAQIGTPDHALTLGAMVRQRTAEKSPEVRSRAPLVAEALPYIGHFQIRNRGTIGGSLAHADPASELPAVMLALEAEMVVRSSARERTIASSDFFRGYLTTALEQDELLTEVRLPAWPTGAGWSFQEISRRHGDFAVAGVATVLVLDAQRRVQEVRIGIAGAGPGPMRAHQAEASLRGQAFSPDAVAHAAEQAAHDVDPMTDLQATAAYRREMVKVLTRRTLEEAATRVGSMA